ncbi:adenosylcobinamide-phosphate synthase CbiB [Alcanivorax limicola]|uniref:adenosylcobinamide-phosphate synthase CbiB n=1 Tax=Alcanivorax limicola TaxID=2874102 RepID=UPI002958D3EF|nr:adenosylcobinamide-phosphate synthase CbiB [Alcanivorax limicola]
MLTHLNLMLPALLLSALLLDALLGEPRRWHPLVGFGRLAAALEQRLNHAPGRIRTGALALLVLVLPWVVLALLLSHVLDGVALFVVQALGLWWALGWRSLGEHARAVAAPLAAGDLAMAREKVACLVSRDAAQLDARGVAAATTESVLENGADAVFASLFWFLLGGLPGVVLHRLVNTLDAMWGYRTPRYLRFGRAAARLDDLLNWVPARLVALTYALCGKCRTALRCWRQQAARWESPNAGPVMAAGAGALGVQLGGDAPYHGGWKTRPVLGEGAPPDADSILRALRLVRRGVLVWLLVVTLVALGLAEGLAL